MGSRRAARRIGIFGGTFDPIHIGHLIVGQEVLERLGLDRLLLVPAHRSPTKDREPGASAPARLKMVQAAVEGDPRFGVLEEEVSRPPPSFTVDTLREVRAKDPEAALHLLLGVDQWAEFARWRSARTIAEFATLVVVARAGEAAADRPPDFEDGPPPPVVEVPVPRIDLSSTLVRERVRTGRPVRYVVPEPVQRIIEAEGLYR